MSDSTILRNYMRPFETLLATKGLRELVINEPALAYTEDREGWHRHPMPDLTYEYLRTLARAASANTGQDIDEGSPICSTTLLGGERCQIVIPPAVRDGTVSFTIRKPSSLTMDMAALSEAGLFSEVSDGPRLDPVDVQLVDLRKQGLWREFLEYAVIHRRNILISGATGSGKTTLAKALVRCIPPHERLVTIEDSLELHVPHANQVRLLYSSGGQGQAQTTAKSLLESSLRMRPDRVLLQELRDGTAFYYVRNVNSGHPGSITTVHANSARLAFEQMTLLVKESEGGRDLGRADIRALLHTLVDVVVQVERSGDRFRIAEIWHEPERRNASGIADLPH